MNLLGVVLHVAEVADVVVVARDVVAVPVIALRAALGTAEDGPRLQSAEHLAAFPAEFVHLAREVPAEGRELVPPRHAVAHGILPRKQLPVFRCLEVFLAVLLRIDHPPGQKALAHRIVQARRRQFVEVRLALRAERTLAGGPQNGQEHGGHHGDEADREQELKKCERPLHFSDCRPGRSYWQTIGLPAVPSEVIGRTATVSASPFGSCAFGMYSVVTPPFGSCPTAKLPPTA